METYIILVQRIQDTAQIPHLRTTLGFLEIRDRGLLQLSLKDDTSHIRANCRILPHETAACFWSNTLSGVQAMYADQLPQYTPSVTLPNHCRFAEKCKAYY